MVETSDTTSSKQSKFNLTLDYRLVVVCLLLVIIGMLALWRPWNSAPSTNTRTISVTGDATLTANPDEFVFSPSYEFKDADKATASTELINKENQVIAGLKKLGVTNDQIKAETDGNISNSYFDDTTNTYDYSANIVVTLSDEALTQKVQDYLVSTAPTGQLSPVADFSTAKRKKLESQARDEATKDARSKADQSARNLGFKVGKVKSVDDGTGFNAGGGCKPGIRVLCPLASVNSGASSSADSQTSTLSVQPGQNELSYSVTVVYYLK